MENRCPKCNIDLNIEADNIKEKDINILSLKLLFGEVSLILPHHISGQNVTGCDLCGATYEQIIADLL